MTSRPPKPFRPVISQGIHPPAPKQGATLGSQGRSKSNVGKQVKANKSRSHRSVSYMSNTKRGGNTKKRH